MYNDRVQGSAAVADKCTNHIPNPYLLVTRSKEGKKLRRKKKSWGGGGHFYKQSADLKKKGLFW
jgi:hypothetical protein